MQGSERKALGEIQPSAGFQLVGSRWRCTFRRGTSVAIAFVPRSGGGLPLRRSGDRDGHPVVSERIIRRRGRGGDRGVGSFRRRPFARSQGRCGPNSLAGRPVTTESHERVRPVLVACGSCAAIGVRCPSRPRPGDWRGVVAVRPVLKHGPRSAGGARVLGAALVQAPAAVELARRPRKGQSESDWGEPRRWAGRITDRAVWSRCGRLRVRAYLLRPERW